MFLLADATHAGFFPDEFLPSVVMSVVFAVVALLLFAAFWKFIDWVTPGDLDKEILGTDATATSSGKSPNTALAIVVAALALGFCWIIAAAIK